MHKPLIKKSLPRKSTSLEISPPYPSITTPSIIDNTSPLPHYSLYNNPPNNFSLRRSQLPSLYSPPYLHNSIPPEGTNIENSSNNSPVHNIWQSTRIYPPTPPSMKFNGIPSTSVNCLFTPPESPAKILSSCRFSPESF